MALKAILDSIEGLPQDVAKEYKQQDGKFYLDVENVENHPAVGALARAKEHEKTERQKQEQKAKELATTLASLTEERDGLLRGAIPKADVDKLENSYKTKLKAREEELSNEINTMRTSLNTLLVENVAQGIAAQLSKSPELMLPHIRGRLKAEIVDGKPLTRVLDKDGSLSALSVEDFKKEIIANPVFAPILVASKASGSSAPNGQGGSASTSQKKLADMTPNELATYMASKE